MVIKAVVFDFGGTLAEGSIDLDEYHSAIVQLLRGFGHDVELSRLRRAITDAFEWVDDVRKSDIEPTFDEVYSRVLAKLNIPANTGMLSAIHDLYRKHFRVTLYPCVEEVVRELSKSYKLAILSNTTSDIPRHFLERSGLIRHFDVVVCSSDIGIRKPDPRIFQHVISMLGVEPSEALHVGNGLKTDIEGAARAGMKAVWIRNSGDSSWTGPSISNVCDLPEFLKKLESENEARFR